MFFEVWAEPSLLEEGNTYSRIQALAAKLITDKEKAKQEHLRLVHGEKNKEHSLYDEMIRQELVRMQTLGLITPSSFNLTVLPLYSFSFHFTFMLARPYLSKDDDVLHICDNPLRKDHIFKVPMIAATAWKGLLRQTATRLMIEGSQNRSDEEFMLRRLQLTRLFGNEKEVELDEAIRPRAYLDDQRPTAAHLYRQQLARVTPTGFVTGRLQFYPTFFNQMDVEIINPHDRKTKAGTHPIFFECVPRGATGIFTLLYVPFDRIGEDEAETYRQAAKDLQLVAQGIKAMMTEYGFGAKTSSGFGVAEDNLVGQGRLRLKAAIPTLASTEPAPAPSPPDLPRYLSAPDQLHPDFQAEDGGLTSEAGYRALIESRGQKYTRRDKQLYDKAKSWWEREGRQLAEAEAAQSEPPPVEAQPVEWPAWSFASFSELVSLADRVAEMLKQGGTK